MKKAIGYKRISSKDQSNHSLSSQEENIILHCETHGFELVSIYTDDGFSARTFDRPDWKKLEYFVKQNYRDIDYIVVNTYDRFSRDLREALNMIEALEKKHGVTVISAQEPIFLPVDHPDYFNHRARYFLDAQTERLRIRYRTGQGVYKANKEGRYLGTAPFGYSNAKDEHKKPIIVLNQDLVEPITTAFNMFLAGETKHNIGVYLRGHGWKRKGKVAVNRLLECPLYAGLVRVKSFNGKPAYLTKGRHEGFLPEDIYFKTQEKLNAKVYNRQVLNDEVPLRGVLRCFCGKKLTAGNSRGKNRYFWYYLCRDHRGININAEKLQRGFREMLSFLRLSAEDVDEVKHALKDRIEAYNKSGQKETELIKKKLSEISGKMDKLERKFIEDGSIDSETYSKWKSRYSEEKKQIEDKLIEFSAGVDALDFIENNIGILENGLLPVYDMSSTVQKQLLLNTVFNQGLYVREGICRTPSLPAVFSHNELILKEKRLLLVEQPEEKTGEISPCRQGGATIEHMHAMLKVINSLKTA